MLDPRRRSEIETATLDDHVILIDVTSGAYHTLNHTGAVIWDWCDGTHSVEEIARGLAATYGIGVELAQVDVLHVLAQLKRAGLLEDARASA
ncbi:MAG: PqqD family protein [Chloroflexi bacterium]|nr:PqqD family protein [Chloroflexota bacterium]